MEERNRVINMSKQLQSDSVEWYLVYLSILAVLLIVLFLIFKFLGYWDYHEIAEQSIAAETNHLIPKKAIPFTYGTLEEDLESGKCNSNISDDFYDGKICIICYNEQRNCFFVPCGHCATCLVCAQRILDEESKTCPVCRRFIHRVKKLFSSTN